MNPSLAPASVLSARCGRPMLPMRYIVRRRRSGFTLLEMLVVMMIVGLFFGLVIAVTRPDDRAQLRLEADRLAQLLELAAAEAQLSGHPIAWTAEESSYRFWRGAEDASWLEIRDDELLHARTLPQGILVSGFRVESALPQGAMRLEFTTQGASLAFTIVMSLGEAHYSIVGSPIGEIRVAPGMGKSDGELAFR